MHKTAGRMGSSSAVMAHLSSRIPSFLSGTLGSQIFSSFPGESLSKKSETCLMHLGSQSPRIITLLTPPDPDVTAESCWKLPLCNERRYVNTVNQIRGLQVIFGHWDWPSEVDQLYISFPLALKLYPAMTLSYEYIH